MGYQTDYTYWKLRAERAEVEVRDLLKGLEQAYDDAGEQAERAEREYNRAQAWKVNAEEAHASLARVRELRRQQFKAPGHVKEAEWINASDLDRALERGES